MPNITTDPGAKKETVYSGPSPQPRQSSGPSAPASSSGHTVYGGPAPKPAGGTVYNGLGAGSTVYGNQQATGTVYNPAQSAAARPAQRGANAGSSKAGAIFYVIAGFSALNTLLILIGAPLAVGMAATRARADNQMGIVVASNVIVIAMFVALGFFASRGSKAAFLIGLLLYGGDTLLLLLSDNAAARIPAIVVHVFFMVSIFKGFRQLS